MVKLLEVAQHAALITRFHQLSDQAGSRREANLVAFLAGGKSQPLCNMGFPGATGAEGNNVLTLLDVRAAGQFDHLGLVE